MSPTSSRAGNAAPLYPAASVPIVSSLVRSCECRRASRRPFVRSLWFALLLVGIACCSLVACRSPRPTTGTSKRTEVRQLVRLPETARRTSVTIGSDGFHFAYVDRTTAGHRVIFSGGADPEFEEVGSPSLLRETFTRVYWAADRRWGENQYLIVENGRHIETGCMHPSRFWFSRNGRRWATVCTLGKGEGGNIVAGPTAVFSNGQLVATYRDVSVPTLSADGAHVAFVAERDDGKHVVVVDGKEQRVLEPPPADKATPALRLTSRPPGLLQFRVVYLIDGSLVTLVYDRDGWAVYRNDQRLASFSHAWTLDGEYSVSFDQFRTAPTILVGSLTGADEAPVVAWWEKVPGEEARWRVAHNGVPRARACEHYWEHTPPLLADDGKHIAYPCWRGVPVSRDTLLDVVADDQQWGPYYGVWGLAFSADGRRLAYAATEDPERQQWRYFINGQPFPLAYAEAWRPRFSPDGHHLAWEAQWRKRMVAVVDGDSVFSFDAILWGPEFPTPNTVAWAVRRGNRVLRVETTFGKPTSPGRRE